MSHESTGMGRVADTGRAPGRPAPAYPAEWPLRAGQVQRLPAAGIGRWLQATGGQVWLTCSGSGPLREADIWLQAGQAHWLPAGSDWVIEGWGGDAGFVLLQAPPPGDCVA